MLNISKLFILSPLALCLAGCTATPEAKVPGNSTAVNEAAHIFPDYRDIVVPPNVAPLNLQITDEAEAYVAQIKGAGREVLVAAADDGKLQFDSLEWKNLLQAAKGQKLDVTLYAQRKTGWVKFPAYTIEVAKEPIDRYLSYRLIEPSYELYRQLGLYQRDLESFNVKTIYENNRNFN